MSDLFLNLREQARAIDFLVENLEYAGPKDQAQAEKMIAAYDSNERLAPEKLADAVKKLAIATWPARHAVNTYFASEGTEEEWERVISTVSGATAHLLQRFRQGAGTESLESTLSHEDADSAFRDAERREVEEVRIHLRQDFWKNKKAVIAKLVKQAEDYLKGALKRIEALRSLAMDLPADMQAEVLSKIERYEDRLLFKGEMLALEILDDEIQYYTDQKEISPLE